jgi:hypothetical protein
MRLVRPSTPTGTIIDGPVEEALSAYNAGTTYALGDQVKYLDSSIPADLIYESAQAGNVGHALTDPAWWTFVSYTNPYRMFDQVANSQTTAADAINTVFFATPLANTVSLLNISAASVRVRVYTGLTGPYSYPVVGGTVVYDETQTLLIADDGVTDWYEYFFGDFRRRTNVIFTDLPAYSDQVIVVEAVDTGNTVAIGTLAVGFGYYIGDTQYGARVGITDYSVKQADDFGFFNIVERTFSKRGSFTFRIPNERVDEIANLLPLYRAVPAVWIGADTFGATFIYGFYKDWGIEITYVSHSIATIEIEGLS